MDNDKKESLLNSTNRDIEDGEIIDNSNIYTSIYIDGTSDVEQVTS